MGDPANTPQEYGEEHRPDCDSFNGGKPCTCEEYGAPLIAWWRACPAYGGTGHHHTLQAYCETCHGWACRMCPWCGLEPIAGGERCLNRCGQPWALEPWRVRTLGGETLPVNVVDLDLVAGILAERRDEIRRQMRGDAYEAWWRDTIATQDLFARIA